MTGQFIEEKVKKVAEFNGIEFFHIKTGQFKTNTINVFFQDRLSRENASKNAMLPAIMRRGCVPFPTFQDIALHLESLYGAIFDCNITKKGERQIIQFYLEFVSEQFTDAGSNLLERAVDLLYEIITHPVVENNGFKEAYVQQEKENLKQLIESRVNDKVQYAVDQCFEKMCKGEPFEIHENGSVEDLIPLNAQNLYPYYQEFIKTLPVRIFITGDLEETKLDYIVKKFSGIQRGQLKSVEIPLVHKSISEEKQFTEKMNVSQGKLSLGFRTNISPTDAAYFPLVVYNGILGGGIHSKLFQNVREKESLAYYAFSRLEKFKGLMIISSGIESHNKDKAQKIMLEQMDAIKNGNISDYEFTSTLKTLETGLKSLRDSQVQMTDYYLAQAIAGTNDSIEDLIRKFQKVTREDVIGVSDRIKLDTVYFLESEEREQ